MIKSAYLHIPFCEHICHYCDFNKVFLKNQPVDEYLDLMDMEMKNTLEKNKANELETIFVGGGTPTALNEKQLEKLLDSVQRHFPISHEMEYTFEANPGDLSKEKLLLLKEGGVNRLSFGVQSFNDDLLKKIGRSHRKADVFRSIEHAREAGFHNISIDLIYSLPDQSINDFRETLKTSLSLDMEHYSAYSLIIEPKTVFYNLMNKGLLPLPTQEEEAEMYEVLLDVMAANGYKQYEISNFAKEGYESRHNITYWDNDEYFGIGAGAHGYVNGNRITNHGPLKKYMDAIKETGFPYKETHHVTKVESMEEEMFLGLRKSKGVSEAIFKEKFSVELISVFREPIESNFAKGLLERHEGHIRLTKKGKFLGNEVFQAFLGVI
ncbi:radical SAM family heme chaperone HemW [Sutcliffiella rhizosphaerae]|uniref:Heme chaperone HemW n=1 Tax=Sutcliffiella rhizosphaerae TaxID=2880967 RepID=A0ABN8A6U6_9BACI|nr:radical SAM family heme chaperone HemW [Sutcliffiella rhizosphaerae]CAG9619375.1 Heme chaperone HemW [Sutcliffiella rhizosphaerae]